jgi:hypothetical protein
MATLVPLQSTFITATTTGVTFSNISQEYTDLEIKVEGLSTSEPSLDYRLNGDTSSSYSYIQMSGTGSAASHSLAANQTAGRLDHFGYMSTAYGYTNTITFFDYTNTVARKSVLSRSGSANNGVSMVVGLWRKTEAINSVTFTGVYAAGTTISLYGIKSGAPQALGGDVVVTDGNYWYHAFLSSGTFTPQRPISVEVLTIAGGGSGGSGGANFGGGGGAGGLLYTASNSVTGSSYPVVVGAGGALSSQADGNNGSNSSFNLLTAVGGGGGAGTSLSSGTARAGKSGGSGGGATYWNGGTAAGGAPTSGQGNKGGDITSSVNNNRAGAGGGGAGVAGANVVTNGTGTVGGNGVNTYSSWASATGTGVSGYYAGGGAGGGDAQAAAGAISGGLGGGGNAQWVVSGVAGVANTGSGGGGSIDPSYVSGAGGSGIVIVRYAV